ncbi:hypothetical protein Misp01_18370 [Microtetraspora sp. NBRC 13810]|uniref:serine/threonine-protein kinase n=1 Tax=Microtetraspora sp. NBRC 13810 TaxID=3030990 RepID=UPI00249FECE5|nr:serine/threonine-protein kinase [Microtetraspora sp. NBRC 13810]GLW06707.1 hypothetical protein Misp01_18370 [Microtetraspora sp. NBRC 13810]
MASPLTPDDPRALGEFRLAGRLGEGGQGVVYLANAPSGEQVAVKLLSRVDAESRARLEQELAALAGVASFCTARVLGADVRGPRPYVVSEFVDGPSLERRVRERGPLRGGELERLAIGTATALAAIQAAGVVHRDFKPANVLLGPDGPRVVDFGIARTEDSVTLTSGLIGTPAYVSPERIAGAPASPASDVFAWAATIVYAATGHAPFGADNVPAVLHRIVNAHPDLSALPPRLRDLIGSCLAKDPARRPSARELMVRLVAPVAAPPATDPAALEELAAHGAHLASKPPTSEAPTAPPTSDPPAAPSTSGAPTSGPFAAPSSSGASSSGPFAAEAPASGPSGAYPFASGASASGASGSGPFASGASGSGPPAAGVTGAGPLGAVASGAVASGAVASGAGRPAGGPSPLATVPPGEPGALVTRPRRRRRGVLAGVLAAAVALAGAAAVVVWANQGLLPLTGGATGRVTPASTDGGATTPAPGPSSTDPSPTDSGTAPATPSASASAPVAATADPGGARIPRAFAGEWSGDVRGISGGQKEIRVELRAGDSTARWAEPASGCEGEIRLTGVTGNRLSFALGLDTGCVPGTVWLDRKGGNVLTYTWRDVPGFDIARETGDLRKQ